MADLTANLAGIISPNPFWLGSGPPTNTTGRLRELLTMVGEAQSGKRW